MLPAHHYGHWFSNGLEVDGPVCSLENNRKKHWFMSQEIKEAGLYQSFNSFFLSISDGCIKNSLGKEFYGFT